MHITPPPLYKSGMPMNMRKQVKVFDMCYHPEEDTVVDALVDPDLVMLASAHSPRHINAVLSGASLNGFSNNDLDYVRHSIQSCASMVAAAKAAVTGKPVVFAPVSGFHHAGFDFCGGYCTFNGLIMAVVHNKLQAHKVAIIDGDGHWGDGTQDIIDELKLTNINHVSLSYSSVHGNPAFALDAIKEALDLRPDLVIYQAGADAHYDDPYGAGYLQNDDWVARDELVFRTCKDYGIPVVFNLAGGYNGNKTLNLHNRTFLTALRVYEPESSRLLHVQDPALGSAGL